MDKMKWYTDARFGMFIHWGLYSIPARGEWVRSIEKISNEDYEKYFTEFNPVNYDPAEWAKIAKNAGQKYAVLTAKHHDGFCLFDSKLTDYKATNTKAGRDLIREYTEAFRREGLRVGYYYSLVDWHHDHYPAYDDPYHPMRGNPAFKDRPYDFSKYIEYMHGQVRELLSNYGKIDVIWFDFSYNDMSGEKWKATELIKMVRSLQPDIIIDNRLGGNMKSANPEIYAGDFYSPELYIPPGGVINEEGKHIPWETCCTLNEHWGYHAGDKGYKTPRQVIHAIVECTSKNGNLLLNIGPDAKGVIPAESVQILEEVGKWIKENGESIYGCSASSLPKPEWGRFTQKGNLLYAHIFDPGIGAFFIDNMKDRVKKARLLADGSEVKIETPWTVTDNKTGIYFHISTGSVLPDKRDTVVEFELI